MEANKLLALFLTCCWASMAVVPVRSQNCKDYRADSACPPGHVEIYREARSGGGPLTLLMCCKESAKPEIEFFRKSATKCRTTGCQEAGSDRSCAALPTRTMDGEEIRFVEAAKGTCELSNKGESGGGEAAAAAGVASYCCIQDSLAVQQVSTVGAEPAEFPYMASVVIMLGQGRAEDCGATIYNSRYLITAAHCMVNEASGEMAPLGKDKWPVMLGRNLKDIGFRGDAYTVAEAIPHPAYSKLKSSTEHNPKRLVNDIALLRLDREISFGDRVKALELAPKDFIPEEHADNMIASGWGVTDDLTSTGSMQRLNLVLRAKDKCFGPEGRFNDLGDKVESLICAGGIMGESRSGVTGKGDSGGPGTCRGGDGRALHCGVVSFGPSPANKCAESQEERYCPPPVFTNAGHFRDWIEGIAGPQEPQHLYQPYLYGRPVPKGSYSYHVHVTSPQTKSCGGTLIAEDIVVTAAHCVAEPDSSNYPGLRFIVGQNELGDQGKAYRANAVAILPGYKKISNKFKRSMDLNSKRLRVMSVDERYENDIAVVRLAEKVDNIPLSGLPRLAEQGEEPMGPIREVAFPRNSSRSGKLMEREYRILDNGECQTRWDRLQRLKLNEKVSPDVLCGVEKFSGGSQCDRELGGGLFCTDKRDGKDVLCGVQVFRLCSWSIPNGFANVGLHRDWIDAAVAQLANA